MSFYSLPLRHHVIKLKNKSTNEWNPTVYYVIKTPEQYSIDPNNDDMFYCRAVVRYNNFYCYLPPRFSDFSSIIALNLHPDYGYEWNYGCTHHTQVYRMSDENFHDYKKHNMIF